jgi:hypothetical protein
MGISSSLGSSALLPAGLGFRNKLINGDMRINQRGAGTLTGSGSTQFAVDSWRIWNGTGTVTFQQSTTAPAGFSNSLLATVTATGAYSTNGYTQIQTKVEGLSCTDLNWGTSNAKPLRLSFWVRASVVGTYSCQIRNGAANRSYAATFTINAANTWEYETLLIQGDTGGTWLTTNGVGLDLIINLGLGTAYETATPYTWLAGDFGATSACVDLAANAGATFYITGVQLEQNYQSTPFELRPIGVELALCQRYYENTFIDVAPALNVGNQPTYLVMGDNTTNYGRSNFITFVVPKRTAPSLTVYSSNSFFEFSSNWATWNTQGTGTTDYITAKGFVAFGASGGAYPSGGLRVLRGHWVASAEL